MKLFVSQEFAIMRLKGVVELREKRRPKMFLLNFPLLLVTSFVISLSCSSFAHADTLSAPETEVGGGVFEERVHACELTEIHGMWCNCDSSAEDVKCNAWEYPLSENSPPWTAIGDLRTVVNLEFNSRPAGALKKFPPSSMFHKLDKLSIFDSKFSKFEVIPSYAFANSSSLSEIVLRNNMIRILEVNSFSNMENVKKINLDHNSIQEINREVFNNLPKLENLFFDSNEIFIIHDFAFKDLDRLTELGLKKNNLTVLAREVFTGLSSLLRLDLQENLIEFLGDHVFADMPNLYDVDLSGNQIRSISSSAFAGLKNLGRLSMQQNKIVTLDPPVFSHLTKIYHIDLKNNALETLTEALAEPIYHNLLQPGMQLLIEGNRLTCDCKILWLQKLYNETESVYLKEALNKTQCDSYHSPAQKRREMNHGLSVRYNSNVTVDAAPPEETTTYAFDGSKNVLDLNTEDFKCHEQQDQKDDSKLVPDKKDIEHPNETAGDKKHHANHSKAQQSLHHNSHIDISSQISKDDPILISKDSVGSGSGRKQHSLVGVVSLLSFTLCFYI